MKLFQCDLGSMLASFHHQCLQLTQKVLKYGYATVCPDGENHCALEPGCWCRCRALPTHTHVFAIWGSMLANFSGRFCIQQGSPPNCRPRHRVSVCVWGLPPHLCPGRAGAAPLGTAEERVEGERFSDSACFFRRRWPSTFETFSVESHVWESENHQVHIQVFCCLAPKLLGWISDFNSNGEFLRLTGPLGVSGQTTVWHAPDVAAE